MSSDYRSKGVQDIILDLPQERLTSITRGHGPRRGNLERLLQTMVGIGLEEWRQHCFALLERRFGISLTAFPDGPFWAVRA